MALDTRSRAKKSGPDALYDKPLPIKGKAEVGGVRGNLNKPCGTPQGTPECAVMSDCHIG